MQTFAESLVSPLEEIFVVLIFAPPSTIAVHMLRHSIVYAYTYIMLLRYDVPISPPIQNFAVLIFAAADLSEKYAKFCTMRKFPTIRDISYV